MTEFSAAQLSLMAESDYAGWDGGKGGDLVTHEGMATGFIEGHVTANAKAQRRITKLESALEMIVWMPLRNTDFPYVLSDAVTVAAMALVKLDDYGG